MLIFNFILVAFISLWNVTLRGKSESNKLELSFLFYQFRFLLSKRRFAWSSLSLSAAGMWLTRW